MSLVDRDVMTADAKREAQIRQDARGWNDKFLLRLLDEARAHAPPGKIAALGVTINELRTEIARLRGNLADRNRENLLLRTELDRLRAVSPIDPVSALEGELQTRDTPPEEDPMERDRKMREQMARLFGR